MLTARDRPTIRWAIIKRLDKEFGIQVCQVHCKEHPDHIAVGVLALIDGVQVARSRFDLPLSWEIGHLHNEIDEIAEHLKSARRELLSRREFASLVGFEKTIPGNGLRGNWPQ